MEKVGVSTVVLTPIHGFHLDIPGAVAIEFAYWRVGSSGARRNRGKDFRKILSVLEKAQKPGEARHIPFIWPEKPRKTPT